MTITVKMIMAIVIIMMMTRVNYGKPYIFPGQRKGLWEGDVILDDIVQVGHHSHQRYIQTRELSNPWPLVKSVSATPEKKQWKRNQKDSLLAMLDSNTHWWNDDDNDHDNWINDNEAETTTGELGAHCIDNGGWLGGRAKRMATDQLLHQQHLAKWTKNVKRSFSTSWRPSQ